MTGSADYLAKSDQVSKIGDIRREQIEELYDAFLKLCSSDTGLTVTEFWEIEGKGNLLRVLVSLQQNADRYKIGESDIEKIESVLALVPIKLRKLKRHNLNPKSHDEDEGIEYDVRLLLFSAMQVISKLKHLILDSVRNG